MADTGISVTFVDEGARHRSVLGYFAHGDAGTALEAVNIFDNASTIGSGRALIHGDTMGLGTFPAGTSLGFHSTADGYRSGRAIPDDLIDGSATPSQEPSHFCIDVFAVRETTASRHVDLPDRVS